MSTRDARNDAHCVRDDARCAGDEALRACVARSAAHRPKAVIHHRPQAVLAL